MTGIPTGKFSNGKLLFSIKGLNFYRMGSTKYLQAFKIITIWPKFASYNDLIFLKMSG